MAEINFTANHAIVFRCDVCGERFVGADPNADQDTSDWMTKHAKWHEASVLRPPGYLVLP